EAGASTPDAGYRECGRPGFLPSATPVPHVPWIWETGGRRRPPVECHTLPVVDSRRPIRPPRSRIGGSGHLKTEARVREPGTCAGLQSFGVEDPCADISS